ncbi:MAG TPA: GNAT family N-acetyltransferase [Abditibacterium sp.]|jgi:predicted acetyltransferase
MNTEIEKVPFEDKFVLQNLLELCLHDYSEFADKDLNSHGLFGYRHLDHYWTEEGRHAFFVRVSGKLAGFVLVQHHEEGDKTWHSIAEFFILRKYRSQGIGKATAIRVFDMFPGAWRVHQEPSNLPAQRFWHKVIEIYTNNNYQQVGEDTGQALIQEFISPS